MIVIYFCHNSKNNKQLWPILSVRSVCVVTLFFYTWEPALLIKTHSVSQSTSKAFSWNFNCRVEGSLVSSLVCLLVPWVVGELPSHFLLSAYVRVKLGGARHGCCCCLCLELHPGDSGRLHSIVEPTQDVTSSPPRRFDLCYCEIIALGQTRVLGLTSKAQVSMDLVHEPCLATGSRPQQPV